MLNASVSKGIWEEAEARLARLRILWRSLSRAAGHWVQPAPPGGTSGEQEGCLPGRKLSLGQASLVLPTALLLEVGRDGCDALLEIWQNQAKGAPDISRSLVLTKFAITLY